MKNMPLLASLLLCFLLGACSTSSSTSVTAYDDSGAPVASKTSAKSTDHAVDTAVKVGTAVKEGAVAGYEWTKDKTVKGYNWVKDKVTEKEAPDAQPSEK